MLLALAAGLATHAAPTAAAGRPACHDVDDYRIVSRDVSDGVGSDVLVRFVPAGAPRQPCRFDPGVGDYVLKNGDDGAQYYLDFKSRYLFLDNGTGPDRTLTVFDVAKRARVVSSGYVDKDQGGTVALGPDSATFWRVTETVPGAKECPLLTKNRKNGLGTFRSEEVVFRYDDASVTPTGKKGCYTSQ